MRILRGSHVSVVLLLYCCCTTVSVMYVTGVLLDWFLKFKSNLDVCIFLKEIMVHYKVLC